MTIDERSRHELYVGLEEVLGQERADTMMALLPPVGWADVATKHDVAAVRADVDHLGAELRAEMRVFRAELRAEIQELRAEMERQTRQIVLALVPMFVAVIGVVLAIAAAFG